MSDLKLDVAAPESPAPAAAKPGGAHPAWRLALPVVFLLLAWILVLYRETALAMVNIWVRSETFTHGFVVPPIAAWLIWRQRGRLALLAPSPAPWCLPALVLVGLFWLLGELAAVNAVTQLALVATLVLAAVAVLGTAVGRNIGFPLLFLFFAVPVGEFLMPTLMEWTANFTVLALRATGIPVFREGLHFVIPSGSWSVVEACSGVRYLIASLMVGTLFAYLNYNTTGKRLVFVVVSALVPIVANWLRAYIIVMLGHLSGNKLAAGVDHLIYGWLFFGVVIMAMFWIGGRWSDPPLAPAAESKPAGTAPGGAARNPLVVVAVFILVALPLAAQFFLESRERAAPPDLSSLAGAGSAAWVPEGGAPAWRPAYEGPAAEFAQRYRKGEVTAGIYVAYYRDQDYRHKLISSTNALVKSNDPAWRQVATGTARTTDAAGNTLEVGTAQLRHREGGLAEGGGLAVWHWFWINGYVTNNEILAKAYTAISRLLGRGDDSALIVVFADGLPPQGGKSVVESLVQAAWPDLAARLLRVREQR